MSLIWGPEAAAQVDAILQGIGKFNPARAEQWLNRLLKIVDQIERFPESGRTIEQFKDEQVRYRLLGKYHIAYLIRSSGLEIAAVWHGSQRPPGSGMAATYGDNE